MHSTISQPHITAREDNVSALSRLSQADIRIDAETEAVALAVQAVGESPAMRSTLDEQEQKDSVPVIEPLSSTTQLDGLNGLVR
jgi:hypothetical protein